MAGNFDPLDTVAKPHSGVPLAATAISYPMPPRCLPKPCASRLIFFEVSWRNGTSSSMISCSPMSAMAAKNGAMECSPSRCARAPPPTPLRSAQTLPTNSPCWVTPPNKNVLIWLNQGAITDPYFSGQEYCILANRAWVTPNVLNTLCRLCPSGASLPGLTQLPSSLSTSIGFITLIPRGRSGQKNPEEGLVHPALRRAEGGVEGPVHDLRRGPAPV